MSILSAIHHGIASHSEQATTSVGRALARELCSRDDLPRAIALYGDLGVGKTTFVRGFAEALGHSDIVSPSFNYFFWYKGATPLIHLDAYRLASPDDYPSLMIDEFIAPQTCFVIEWPDNLGDYLPRDIIKLRLGIEPDTNAHSIKLLHG